MDQNKPFVESQARQDVIARARVENDEHSSVLDGRKEEAPAYAELLAHRTQTLSGKQQLAALRGQRVILLQGHASAGKSTLAQAFASSVQNEDAHAKTQVPGVFALEKASGRDGAPRDVYLVDGAGINDADSHNELPNQTAIHQILKNALCFKLVVLISGTDFENEAAPMVELLTSVLRKCSKEALRKRPMRQQKGHEMIISRFIEPFVMKFEQFQGKSQCDAKFDQVLETFNMKLKHYQARCSGTKIEANQNAGAFQGLQYPQDEELEDFITLLEEVRAKYQFIDQDDVDRTKSADGPGIGGFVKCRDAVDKLLKDFKSKSFGKKPFGMKEHLNQDLPRSLYEDMKRDLIPKLTGANSLEEEEVRDACKSVFSEVLSEWKGPNTDYLLYDANREMAIHKFRSQKEADWQDVNWCLNNFLPQLEAFANTMKASKDAEEMKNPVFLIKRFIFQFIREQEKFSEDDTFDFHDWLWAFKWMETNQNEIGKAWTFKESEEGKDLQLQEALKMLSLAPKWSEKQINALVMQFKRHFLSCLQIVAPDVYSNRRVHQYVQRSADLVLDSTQDKAMPAKILSNTIKVDRDLEITQQFQNELSIKAGLAQLAKIKDQSIIEAWSDYGDEAKVIKLPAQHALLQTFQLAHAHHWPLQLAPTDFWILVMQGMCQHMKLNSEELRSKFVDFDGKKQITVSRSEFVQGSPDNDWPSVFNEFSEQIKKFIGNENHETLTPSFSTSTPLTEVITQMSLMNAMQNFFSYKCKTDCGISQVKLQGTVEDWEKLKEYTKKLEDYNLGWWTENLMEIYDNIIDTLKTKLRGENITDAQADFWKYCFKYYYGGGSGVNPSIDGWIINFIPYINDQRSRFAQRNLKTTQEEYDAGDKNDEQSDENSDEDFFLEIDLTQPGLDIEQLKKSASGVNSTPFIWQIGGKEVPMQFLSGFAGASITEDNFIKAQLGWAIAQQVEPAAPKKKKAAAKPAKEAVAKE